MDKFNPYNLAKFFFLLFLITLFFPVRYVFPTSSSFATGFYSDFTSISLYLSDIFLFIAFIFTLWSYKFGLFKQFFAFRFSLFAFIIWLILATFLFNESISGLNIWYFFKFLELIIVAYETSLLIFKNQEPRTKHYFLWIFIALGTLQSVIGLLQFLNQSPIGLNLIGEQVIGPGIWGVAKVVSSGTEFIRAYGTFPHPNLLSAFLLTTIFINIYLLTTKNFKNQLSKPLTTTNYSLPTTLWLNLALFINILGLAATFSRGAYLALGFGLVILTISSFSRRSTPAVAGGRWLRPWINVVLSIVVAFLLFKPFVLSRATISDPATIERRIYNQIALNMVKDKPIFGLGIGESVLHMKRYSDSDVDLNPRQIQPIHNYFLLSAAELGIVGSLLLVWIFIRHLSAIWKLIGNWKLPARNDFVVAKSGGEIGNYESLNYRLLLFTILLCFLILMNFDHYFYTLQQTQMLLWVFLGLMAAETKNPALPAFTNPHK